MKRYWKYARPYLYAFILGPILMITEVVGEVVLPALMAQIINVGAANRDVAYILEMGGVMILTALVMMGGGIGGAWFAAKASISFGADLRNDCFKQVQKFSFRNIDSFSTGSLVTRLTNDITQVQNLIMMGLRMMLRAPGMLIGAIIMVHGDNSGLVLPPKVAPVQVVIVPIQQKKEGVLEKAQELKNRLSGFRVKVDDTDKSPGWKFAEAEMRGIPVRVEIGPKDIEAGRCVLVRRDTREKIECALDEIEEKAGQLLETSQKDMLERARVHRDAHTYVARTMDEMEEILTNRPGFVKAMWCGCQECEDKIKEKFAATSRCMPFEQEEISDVCVCCQKPAKKMVYWGKAY